MFKFIRSILDRIDNLILPSRPPYIPVYKHGDKVRSVYGGPEMTVVRDGIYHGLV